MIDPQVVITQITTLNIFKKVGGSADYAATHETGHVIGDGPNAYVVPLADDNQPPASPGGPQMAMSGIGVIIVLTKRGDLTGEKSLDALLPLRRQLQAGISKFSPFPGAWPLFSRGGRLLDFKTGSLWWMDEYFTRYGFNIL